MELTGKCQKDFIEYCRENDIQTFSLDEKQKTYILIDFFDYIGIVIFVDQQEKEWWYRINDYRIMCDFGHKRYIQEDASKNRIEAMMRGVFKANDLYNENEQNIK